MDEASCEARRRESAVVCTVVWRLALSPHSKKVPGSNPSRVSVPFLPPSRNMHVKLTGDSNLNSGVSETVFLCVGPLMD